MLSNCPLCATDEYSTRESTDDGRAFATCTGSGHPEPWVYEPVDPRLKQTRGDGLGADLGIWDRLLDCVAVGAGPVPYGDVEDSLFERHPDAAQALLERYGHRWRDPEHRSGRYSMSTYLAARLSELAKEGHLGLTWGPATGPWSHLSVISHWARAG